MGLFSKLKGSPNRKGAGLDPHGLTFPLSTNYDGETKQGATKTRPSSGYHGRPGPTPLPPPKPRGNSPLNQRTTALPCPTPIRSSLEISAIPKPSNNNAARLTPCKCAKTGESPTPEDIEAEEKFDKLTKLVAAKKATEPPCQAAVSQPGPAMIAAEGGSEDQFDKLVKMMADKKGNAPAPRTDSNAAAPITTQTAPVGYPSLARPAVEKTSCASPPKPAVTTTDKAQPPRIQAAPRDAFTELDARDLHFLAGQGYPRGLIQALAGLRHEFAKQIWVVDNSESMTIRDGTMLTDAPNGGVCFKHPCSRWDELVESVVSHIELAGACRLPTSFRLLNDPGSTKGPQNFGILCDNDSGGSPDTSYHAVQAQVRNCLEIMQRNTPIGVTPLLQHIVRITQEVAEMRGELLTSGKRVAIVIATDGIPSDCSRDIFLGHLRKLEKLPVWLVIRLCTDDPEVVDFYNSLDDEIKINVDVVDDYQGEATDICQHNPFLNYAMPLHRAREMGFNHRVLDFLDECPLSKREQKEVCGIIFGQDKMEKCPEPNVDWEGFLNHVESLQESEQLQWDPIEKATGPWFNFVGDPGAKLGKMRKMRRKKRAGFFGRMLK